MNIPPGQLIQYATRRANCGICLSRIARNGVIHQGGEAHPYHDSCLKVWLQTNTYIQQSATQLTGRCPGCRYVITHMVDGSPIQNQNPSAPRPTEGSAYAIFIQTTYQLNMQIGDIIMVTRSTGYNN